MENQTLGNITKEQENLSAIIRTKVRFLCSHTNQKKINSSATQEKG